ncbi:unnamed protein product [Cercospora beticola]|nr:unnamed protein product [Cercospora beticola]
MKTFQTLLAVFIALGATSAKPVQLEERGQTWWCGGGGTVHCCCPCIVTPGLGESCPAGCYNTYGAC